MRKSGISFAVTIALFVAAFSGVYYFVHKPEHAPVVLIDNWWSVDMAKDACRMWANINKAAEIQRCIGDPADEVRKFEGEVSTFFATNPLCHGIILTSVSEATVGIPPRPGLEPTWQLMIDFVPGEPSQSWTLAPVSTPSHHEVYKNGQGTPKQIAHSICAIVNQIGGTSFTDYPE